MFSQEIFAARLKILRKERNLALEKLGNEIGVSKQAVGRWEKGEREPMLRTLWALADFYEVTLDYLVGRTDQRK